MKGWWAKPKAHEASVKEVTLATLPEAIYYERLGEPDEDEEVSDIVGRTAAGGGNFIAPGRPLNWKFTKNKSASNEFDPASLVNVTRQSSANTYNPAAFGKK